MSKLRHRMRERCVLRGVPYTTPPDFAIVRLNSHGGGTDIAWFFKHEDAVKYLNWMNGKKSKP